VRKRSLLPALLISLLAFAPLAAQQEEGAFSWDMDTLFDTLPADPASSPSNSTDEQNDEHVLSEVSLLELVRQPGFVFDGRFEFLLGFAPGWNEVPWFDTEERIMTRAPAAKMQVSFNIDAQFSNILRLNSTLFFTIPNFSLQLGDFFFDYNIEEKVFIRGGKFNQRWGISNNFPFTDLLSRVPPNNPRYVNEPLIIRADIPIKVGGFQLLSLTRANLLEGETFLPNDLAYGVKYNLALTWIDIDVGSFFQEEMALRGFLSIKTTIGNTELYNEWLGVYDFYNEQRTKSAAASVGFIHEFFDNRLSVNGEFFYNTELDGYRFVPESNLTEATTTLFPSGINVALNLLYRLRIPGSPRIFLQTLYAPEQDSAQLVPGFRLNLFEHLELSFAVPMALGKKNGYYYQHPNDPANQNRPFAIVLMLALRGNLRVAQRQ